MKQYETQPDKTIKLYFDGASRKNPGPAGAGWVVLTPLNELQGAIYLGNQTNNQAEYLALLKALKFIETNNLDRYALLEIYGDSELIIKQLKGEYSVKSSKLRPLYEQVKEKIRSFKSVTFTWIPRSENSEADKLANEVIDNKLAQIGTEE